MDSSKIAFGEPGLPNNLAMQMSAHLQESFEPDGAGVSSGAGVSTHEDDKTVADAQVPMGRFASMMQPMAMGRFESVSKGFQSEMMEKLWLDAKAGQEPKLVFENLSWGDANMKQLAQMLQQDGGCPNGTLLQLTKNNAITSSGLAELNGVIQSDLLAGLKTLDLRFCTGLTILPPSIGQLAGLVTLDLSSCSSLLSLPALGGLVQLETIELVMCTSLVALPDSMPPALQRLDLSSCGGLATLPESLGALPQLRMLNVTACARLSTLPDLSKLQALEHVEVYDCPLAEVWKQGGFKAINHSTWDEFEQG